MSEQANAPHVWMRWALALAIATGTVAGAVIPALAQDDQSSAGASSAAQPSENPTFEQIVAGNLSEATGQEIVAAEPAPEQPAADQPVEQAPADQTASESAPVEEAPAADAPVEEAPVEQAPVEEAPVEQAPAQDFTEQAPADQQTVEQAQTEEAVPPAPTDGTAATDTTVETPYYQPIDPVQTNANPIFNDPAAQTAIQEANGTTPAETQTEAATDDSGGGNADGGSGGGQNDVAVEDGSTPQSSGRPAGRWQHYNRAGRQLEHLRRPDLQPDAGDDT